MKRAFYDLSVLIIMWFIASIVEIMLLNLTENPTYSDLNLLLAIIKFAKRVFI